MSEASHYGMTRRMRELLDFIESRTITGGVPPSYDEMMVNLGLNSKSGVHRLVKSLEERGLVYRLPNRARTVIPAYQRNAGILVSLPPELEERLRLVATTAGVTPETLVARYVHDRIGLPFDRPTN